MANGKYALGICDRSGQIYKLRDLVFEITNGRRNGLRVGRDMVDPDHPQNHVGRIRPHDEQSIPDARPDVAETATTNTSFDDRFPHTAGTRS
tara:strand:+ start:819 stop:1094 length:276 start_codon:yes stop_codon:yes gene_type:complete